MTSRPSSPPSVRRELQDFDDRLRKACRYFVALLRGDDTPEADVGDKVKQSLLEAIEGGDLPSKFHDTPDGPQEFCSMAGCFRHLFVASGTDYRSHGVQETIFAKASRFIAEAVADPTVRATRE